MILQIDDPVRALISTRDGQAPAGKGHGDRRRVNGTRRGLPCGPVYTAMIHALVIHIHQRQSGRVSATLSHEAERASEGASERGMTQTIASAAGLKGQGGDLLWSGRW